MTLDPAWLREDWAKYDAERKELDEAWGPKAWAASAAERRMSADMKDTLQRAAERDRVALRHIGSVSFAGRSIEDRTGVPKEHVDSMVDRGLLRSPADGVLKIADKVADAYLGDAGHKRQMDFDGPRMRQVISDSYTKSSAAASSEAEVLRDGGDSRAPIERDHHVLDWLDQHGPAEVGKTLSGTGVRSDHLSGMKDRGLVTQVGDNVAVAPGVPQDRPARNQMVQRSYTTGSSTSSSDRPVFRVNDFNEPTSSSGWAELHRRYHVVHEAEVPGAARTKWDDMHEDELRKHIAKFKAMGDKAPAVPMLRATQALARKVALNESWEQWDLHRKLGGYAGMKSGPWGAGKDSPGRGPTGKLRNFKSMSDAKLHATVGALQIHGEDHEAHEAAQSEWLKRHPVAKKPKQLSL